jgi:hypothetical protein
MTSPSPKPAPEALELALTHLSIPPHDAVYVGDAHADFEMSRAAGVRFVGVASEFANLIEDHPEYALHSIESLPTCHQITMSKDRKVVHTRHVLAVKDLKIEAAYYIDEARLRARLHRAGLGVSLVRNFQSDAR